MSGAPSIVTYNGVAIEHATIHEYRSIPVYDESGVVLMSVRQQVVVSGVVAYATEGGLTDELNNIRDALMKPRRVLTISFGSALLVQVDPAYSGLPTADQDSGPRPVEATVTRVMGGRVAMVRFSVEWMGSVDPANPPLVLSHRWSQTFTVDELNYGVRIVRGALVLATTADPSDIVNPDTYRALVYPPYIRGWQRMRAEFVTTPDSRVLQYTIEDREGYRPFPGGAMRGEGTYTVAYDNGKTVKHFHIRLEGQKGDPPGALVAGAYNAMLSRVNLQTDVITQAALTENLFANDVTLTVVATTPGVGGTGLSPQAFAFFQPLESPAPTDFKQPDPYGRAIIKAALQQVFTPGANNPDTPATFPKAQVIASENFDPGDVQMAVVPSPLDPGNLPLSEDAAIMSLEQIGEAPYVLVAHRVTLDVQNQVIVLTPADPTHRAVVQQIGAPVVRYRHSGRLVRDNEIPTLKPFQTSEAGALIENWSMNAGPLEPRGDRANLRFSADYAYDVRIVYDPANLNWQQVTAHGGQLTQYRPATGSIPYDPSPSLEAQARLLVVPSTQTV